MPGSITVYSEVTIRDEFGRFIEHCKEAARKTADDAAKEGARVARSAATKKTGAMGASIRPSDTAPSGISFMAQFSVGTDHWKYQEDGTPPHEITGSVSFFWEREARRWNPGPNMISHPGNRAVHFMLAGYAAAEAELVAGMNRNYRIDASL